MSRKFSGFYLVRYSKAKGTRLVWFETDLAKFKPTVPVMTIHIRRVHILAIFTLLVERCCQMMEAWQTRESAGGRAGQRGHTSQGSDPSPTHPLGTTDYATERSPTCDSSPMPLER